MSAFDIVVIVVLSAAVTGIIAVNIYRRFIKKDKNCSCGCEECGMCSSCSRRKKSK